MVVLTLPKQVVEANYVERLHEYKDYPDFVNTNANKYCLYICGLAGATVLFGFISKFSFGVLGENVTLRIRKDLYSSILKKNIGWFDKTENAPAILTAAMA